MAERQINMLSWTRQADEKHVIKTFGGDTAKQAWQYHRSFPDYQETPLADLQNLAQLAGVSGIYVKDESYRFGLNAFKGLGGSYAVGRYLKEKFAVSDEDFQYQTLTDPEFKKQTGEITFVTATDGNHGRGIAWTANRLKQRSVVYMPKGSAEERLHNIQAQGAEASITDLNYDDAVRKAAADADANGWVLVQDTSWDGYEKIPTWIMQGYTTMAYEAARQLCEKDIKPTHVFLQAGVGAMSGSITGFVADVFGDEQRHPIVTIVEPDQADCVFRTAKANDGKLHIVTGDLSTIMAGLACGEPCGIGWEVLRSYADYFVSMPDWVAAKGMRILGNPLDGDPRVISGESGAAGFGFVMEVLMNPEYADYKAQLGLDENSRILCISTEGDTDKKNYRKIVWEL